MKAILIATALALAAPASGVFAAECVGRNLIEALPAADRAAVEAATRATPYHSGMFWTARKGEAEITLIGTYHFADPRHQATLDRFAPVLERADTLLVEAGPEEEARLTRELAEDPSLTVATEGPTLPERLTEEEWQALSAALAERGIPAIIASRLRPWYVATLMGVSPCMMAQLGEGGAEGLDHHLIERAEAANIPVAALEPWDTLFTVFGGMTPEEELDMIRSTLPSAMYADDYAVTLVDAYFDEESWQIWEFGRIDGYRNSGLPKERVDEMIDDAQEALLDRRNASWIAPLTRAAQDAATRGKGVVAAFGALHLPGENGVLRLLERDGWQITRIGG